MSAHQIGQAVAIADADARTSDAELPTYSELAEALKNSNGRLRLLINADHHKMLDAVYFREGQALLARLPSATTGGAA